MTDYIARLTEAVGVLAPQPRVSRWNSLSSCVVDAVWSIGANYDRVTDPVTRKAFIACAGEDTSPFVSASDVTTPDPVPLAVFRRRFPSVESLVATTNRQRTSTRGGILKADAVLRHVDALEAAGIQTRQDAAAVMKDESRFEAINAEVRRIPGEGGDGVRRGYLWMLVGDDGGVKPDRMVLRWLAAQGVSVDASQAGEVLRGVAEALTSRSGATVTPWMVDHAVWKAGRDLPRI